MNDRKILLSLFLCVSLLLGMSLPGAAVTYNLQADLTAQAVYLYNLETESMIYEKNSTQKMYPASLTKIMTAILALENTTDLDARECVFPGALENELYLYQMRVGAISLGGLRAGEILSMRQLLYASMLPSANEAAMIIAEHIAGSQAAFADMMNQKAREIGATGTNFVNANGLHDPDHYTTAEDIFKIAMYAMDVPGFMEIASATSYDSGPTNYRENVTWSTTIRMQVPDDSANYYAGLRGIKTGTVPEAGDCFISTCTRDGFTYVLVLLGCEERSADGRRGAFVDTKKIYDEVFENLRRKSLVEKGAHEGDVPLRLSMEKDRLKLMTGARFTHLVPKATEVSDVTKIADVPDSINAPITKGDYVGELRLLLAGEEIGKVPLLAAETVEASAMLVLWEKVKEIMGSFWFKFIVVMLVLLIILYIALMILRNRNRRRRNYKPRRRI